MQETWVPSLDWEDPLEKGKAIHSSILAQRIPWTAHGVAKSWTGLNNFHFHFYLLYGVYYQSLSMLFRTMAYWRRKWQQLAPVFLPGKLHGQKSLAGYSTWCCRLDLTEHPCTYTHTYISFILGFFLLTAWFNLVNSYSLLFFTNLLPEYILKQLSPKEFQKLIYISVS